MSVSLAELIPESTFWHNLRKLREMGLVEFGNGNKLKLTNLGKIFAQAKMEKGGTKK